jgi:RND family efflux transporter MFP subunit
MQMSLAPRIQLVLVCAFLGVLLPSPGAGEQRSEAAPQKDIVTARSASRTVTLTGYTRARHVMDIISEEAGRCVEVRVDVGDPVGPEGIYAVLDTTFIDLAIRRNRVHQKRLKNMIAYHGKEVHRYEQLVKRQTAAQAKLDALQNDLDQARFELQALEVEESELRERRLRHLIKVPEGWRVSARSLEPGEWVAVGRTLGRAGDFRRLLVPFALSPEEYTALREANRAVDLYFPHEGGDGHTVEASIERISPAFDPETRKIQVDLGVSGGLHTMRGGLRAELLLGIPDASGAVLLPASAVEQRYDEYWVTRVDGKEIRVFFLGTGPQNTARIRSPEVQPGDRFVGER